MTQSRTHTCGELRLANAGETVTLVGWMENIREVGNNFAFLVLRDFYGTTQVVIENEEMMNIVKPLNKESTISVTGIVRERTSKNPKLPTGDIEIAPTEIIVLGRCRYNELPFEINHSREADESQRLKYRYLDLRNPEVKANIILRCNVIAALRQAMMAHDFLEITTPILTASSPRPFDAAFEALCAEHGVPQQRIGEVTGDSEIEVVGRFALDLDEVRRRWQAPLRAAMHA